MSTITHTLAPEPFWIIINNEGTVAGGARMFTKRSLNKVQDKIVYQDAAGTIAWPNPIIFDLNGVQGPFYWTVDSTALNDTYFLQVYEAPVDGSGSDRGPLIWDIDNFSPGTGGGGGDVTTYNDITNYIANNQFIDHIDDVPSPTNTTNLVIAPSNHKGFTPALIAPVVGTYGVVGPDIRFIKNTTVNADSISFPLFTLADFPLDGDVTPVDYIRYVCTTGLAGETYKCFQFPITQKVKNLANTQVTFGLWAAVDSTPVTINLYARQYYGNGTAATLESTSTRLHFNTIALTSTWTWYPMTFTVPDTAGNSIGTPGLQTDDDALYIQVEMPLSAPCDVKFTKPALYLGTVDPNMDFDNYDQINSINSTPRTGDIKTTFVSNPASTAANITLKGWVPMNDGSIGNVASGATTRANKDTFQLYKTIWDGVIDTWAPVSTGRGATAVADFLAGKTLTLPRSLGRAMAGAGTGAGLTARVLGQYLGAETISTAAMPSHTHPTFNLGGTFVGTGLGGDSLSSGGGGLGTVGTTGTTGSGAADGNMEPTSFFNVFIKL
jgi:hypothetical protein